MSPVRRTKSSSVESRCSKRFFSRMTCWDFCGLDHRLGLAACLSISARCWRKVLASKVLLEFADFALQQRIFLLEILDHSLFFPFFFSSAGGGSKRNKNRSQRDYCTGVGQP